MKLKAFSRWYFIAVLPFALWVPSLMAQSSGTSGLTGVVKDPSGASIPNVTVTLTSSATAQERTTTTSADGTYRFVLLPPGAYKVRFAATGFKTAEVESITLNVTETPVLDRTLEVGAQSEEVTVSANAEILQTQTSTLGTVVNSQTITDLGLASRNYTQVLSLSAGAASNVENAAAFGKGTLDMAVNGATTEQNNFQMDGVSIVNAFGAGIAGDCGIYVGIAIPSPDAIAEFKVQTSTFDASYGRNPGANVNVITKSGTNNFHGSLFEFFRNEDLNANSFFQNSLGGGSKQVLKQNQFGGTFGGPIKKDKLFFFGSYQGTRQRNGVAASGTSNVTLPPLPAGDRSAPAYQAALGAAMCPENHPNNPVPYQTGFGAFVGAPFFATQIACDGSNISPVAMAIIRSKNPDGSYYMPASTNGGFQNVTYSSPAQYTGNQYLANADYLLNSKNTIAMRYLFSEDPQVTPFGIAGLPGMPTHSYYANTDATLKVTTILTNNLVNEAHAAMQRNIANGSDLTPQYTPASIGQTPIIPTQTQPSVNLILGGPSIGGTLAPYVGPATQFNYGDQISWTHGKHTIRAGGDFEADQWNLSFKSLARGFLITPDFADFMLGLPGCNGNGACFGHGPATGTTGAPIGVFLECLFCVRSGPNGIIHGYREKDIDFFVQDDWKVSSKLTLNLGLRWEYDAMLGDHYGNLTNVWPSLLQTVPNPPTSSEPSGASLVGYVVAQNYLSHYNANTVGAVNGQNPPPGVKVLSGNSPTQGGIPKDNFGPRFGFAYKALERLVIRGGVGLFYDRVGSSNFVHAVEQGDPYAVTLDYGSANPYSLANPYPSEAVAPLAFSPRYFNPVTGANSALNTPFYSVIHTPLTRQYNLTFQYEFLKGYVLEAGFVGSSSINQVDYNHNYNLAQLASATSPINGQTNNTLANAVYRVPYLGYQAIGLQGTGYDGYANYNSLQATVRKAFSHGLTFQGAYTWSKDLTVISFDGQANVNNASVLGQQYGPSSFSRPQRFVLSYSYQLPFGNPKGALGYLAKGWQVTGVTTIQGGQPMSVYNEAGGSAYYGGNNSGTGEGGNSTAQLVSGVTYGQIVNSGGIQSHPIVNNGSFQGLGYFNTAAFTTPPAISPTNEITTVANCPGCATLFGNSGQGIFRGPGQVNFDASLIKTTPFREGKQSIQFRAEFYNLANHPQFANPGNQQSTTATFGLINATTTAPRIIQLALKYQF
jgi:hypothetical protein